MTITNIPVDPWGSRRLDARSAGRLRFPLADYVDTLAPVVAAILVVVAAYAAHLAAARLALAPVSAAGHVLGIALCGAVIAYLVFRHAGAEYGSGQALRRLFRPLPILLKLTATFAVLSALVLGFGIEDRYPPQFFLTWYAGSIICVALTLAFVSVYLRRLPSGRTIERIAIYGKPDLVGRVLPSLAESGEDVNVTGIYDDPELGGAAVDTQLKGGLRELVACARSGECDRIVLALPISDRERIAAIMAELESLPTGVSLCPEILPPSFNVRGADKVGSLLLLNVQDHPLGLRGTLIKSMFDYVVGTLALIVFAPLMVLIAIAIKLDSRGPVFFVQARGGYRDSVVQVIKFRTMTVLEDGPVVVQAQRGDKRITRVGRFLRRTSLDELPQLFNVLSGDLSLVGPRPHALVHDRYYREIINRYASRQRMKPGITGWAQVNGLRSETSDPDLMCQRVNYDLHYIENWSPWLDLRILFRTVAVIFFDKKAY